MKHHQVRAQAATMGMVRITFQTSLKALIESKKSSVGHHNRVCIPHGGTTQSSNATELSTTIGPAVGYVTTEVTEVCYLTGFNGVTFRICTQVECVGPDTICYQY
jgi:hypothetical protein